MVENLDNPGWDDNWITVTDLDRTLLAVHPWSLSGGGAVELLEAIGSAASRQLSTMVTRIGFFGVMGSDEAMSLPPCAVSRHGLEAAWFAPVVVGDGIRDYAEISNDVAWFPYTDEHDLRPLTLSPSNFQWMWPLRTDLGNRATFSGGTYFSDGRPWYEWHQLPRDQNTSRWSIVFAEVASHNHFVLDRGGKVFKQTAPVIKLPEWTTEDQAIALLGVLNSSTACFWLRQMSKAKGGAAEHLWLRTYQFNGRRLAGYPLPTELPLARGRALDSLAQERVALSPSEATSLGVPSPDILANARLSSEMVSARMVAIQEELDWEVYRLYGLTDEDLTYDGDDLPGLALGERSFEIVLARAVKAGEEVTAWFTHHGSVPITEIPGHWPLGYRELVQRRIDRIASDPSIRLLERPEYKRCWESGSWEVRQERALREWLLDRLEDRRFWFDVQGRPRPRSVAQLADDVARDADLLSVMALREGRPDVPVTQSLLRLLADEAEPFLAAYRYTESGLRKHAAWEETWALQRREDGGERVGTIPAPPKYEDRDYCRLVYARMRGKLDVPKERFILYPETGRETDPTPLLGWAGWDHAQQSLALSLIIGDRERDGWDDDRLIPLVAGLAELQPWVEQWHGEVDSNYGVSLAAFCREQLTSRAAQVGKTLDELAAWRPAASAARGRRARSAE